MISRLLKVTLTEWKLFVTDPAAVLLLVVAGILYAFYYPTAYVNQTVTRVPVAVVDLDHSAKSRELTRMAAATQQVEVKAVYNDMLEAESAMAREDIFGFMVIPENMEHDLLNKKSTKINIFTHGAYVMLHGTIGTAFSTCALTVGAVSKVKAIALGKKVPSAKAMAMRDPMPLSIQTMFNNTGSYSNYVVPSVLVLILLETALLCAAFFGGTGL
jgi:ABC-2 type transport system permease protein